MDLCCCAQHSNGPKGEEGEEGEEREGRRGGVGRKKGGQEIQRARR